MYEDWRDDVVPCYYCGMGSSENDHVVPRSIIKGMERFADPEKCRKIIQARRLLVPVCRECNLLLSGSYQETLEKRKGELKKRLAKKYKKMLSMPEWEEEEVAELGPALQRNIKSALRTKNLIKRRLSW